VPAVVVLLAVITAAGFAQVPTSHHVILVIDENSSFTEVMGNMQWLVSQGNSYGYAASYKSDNGGSLLDYLWLASGNCQSSANCTQGPTSHDFNCSGNDCYYPHTTTSYAITDDNIFRELNNRGISWKVYAQSYAAAGGTVTSPDNANGTSYYRRHNGATWYSDVLSNVNGSANKVVDLSQLSTDLANGALPRFSIIAPDGNHDAHDCPVGMKQCTTSQKLGAADEFLDNTLTPILNTPYFQPGGDGLIFVTFDECGGGTDQGCGAAVYTGVIGPKVLPHTISNMAYKHENTLRTIFDALGINNYPGNAATAGDMFDFFVPEGQSPQVAIGSPASGTALNANAQVVTSPLSFEASAIPGRGKSISGWYVYVDGNAVYNAGDVSSINPTLKLSLGPHTIVATAWDTSGAHGSETAAVLVSPPRPTVSVLTPTQDLNSGAPVNFIADGSPSSGQNISKWAIFVDGTLAYSAGPVTPINTNIAMTNGAHNVKVRMWDTSGGFGEQDLYLTVSPQPSVAVATPLPGSNVNSTFSVQASAAPSPGHTITGWYVYLDGNPVYHAGAVNSINTNVSVGSGEHTLLVRAWDTSNGYGDQIFVVNGK
jgi:hypothetical protein